VSTRLVLASGSPARLATLRAGGLDPEVVVSGVDETARGGEGAEQLCRRLATAKAYAVAGQIVGDAWVVGCDSVLDLDGDVHGKPADADAAVRLWRSMRGRSATLRTGHCVVRAGEAGTAGAPATLTRVAATVVSFASISDAEIDAYVATNEPLAVAGAFSLDGLGAAFVSRIAGDPHNVVGISLPLLREMLIELGVAWTDVWPTRPGARGRGR
jgi:septum formation protein